MSIASSIAVAGMAAASLRLQVSANNVANVVSSGPLPASTANANFPGPYVPARINQVARAGGGTNATVNAVSPGTVPISDPTASYADGHGMVASPNVDLASKIVQQLLARVSFAANAPVIRANSKMTALLLDITSWIHFILGSWSTAPGDEDGCGGLTGVTPLLLYRAWIVETAKKFNSPVAP